MTLSATPLLTTGSFLCPLHTLIGYVPKAHDACAREEYDNMDPEAMWRDYVSLRRPLVLNGLIDDNGWQGLQWRSLDYLRSMAGSTEVKVEPIDPVNDHFGTSAKRNKVRLSDFLSLMADSKNAGKWYMTTQYADDGEDDPAGEYDGDSGSDNSDSYSPTRSPTPLLSSSSSPPSSSTPASERVSIAEATLPAIDLDFSLPPPTDALAHLFPLPTPKLMGGLVLQQCNLWMGNGTTGKSSGLHHDFHDNLYLLLSGRKRFLIWPPSAQRWLEPHGTLQKIHYNGFVEYAIRGQPILRPDGLTTREALAWLVRARKRAILEADERAAWVAGEGEKVKTLRKGKARQTYEQADAAERLHVAEAQLLLMDAEHGDSLSDVSEAESDADDSDDASEDDIGIFGNEGVATESGDGDSDLEELLRQHTQHRDSQRKSGDLAVNDAENSDSGASFVDDSSTSGELKEMSDESISSEPPRKRSRAHAMPKLRIPRGGLPGGLRGSVDDLDGDGSDALSGEMSDDDGAEVLWIGEDGDDIDDFDNADDELAALQMRAAVLSRMQRRDASQNLPSPTAMAGDSDPELELASDSSFEPRPANTIQLLGREGSVDDGEGSAVLSSGDEDDWAKLTENHGQAATFTSSGSESGSESNDTDHASLRINGNVGRAVQDKVRLSDFKLPDVKKNMEQLAFLANMQDVPREISGAEVDDDEEDEDEDEESGEDDDAPPSFSRIRPQVLHWYFGIPDDPTAPCPHPSDQPPTCETGEMLLAPRKGCPRPIEVHLRPGQMLYLPAGWYHEVTSYCDESDNAQSMESGNVNDNETDANVHMALNYWFHPPTAVRRHPLRPPPRTRPKGMSSSRSEADELDGLPSAAHPYMDEEVWTEIRQTVRSRVDKIRKRAAARAAAASAPRRKEVSVNRTDGEGASYGLAADHRTRGSPSNTAAAAAPKRKRDEED